MITEQEVKELGPNGYKKFDPKMEVDWQGNTIPENEPADSQINVWVFDPGIEGDNEVWIRSYFDAMDYAQELCQSRMDDTDENDLIEHGISVNIKLIKVRLQDYLEVQDEEVF